jgi:hypothetical protein
MRLLNLTREGAEDIAEAEATRRAKEPRVSWKELKAGCPPSAQQQAEADDARPAWDQP